MPVHRLHEPDTHPTGNSAEAAWRALKVGLLRRRRAWDSVRHRRPIVLSSVQPIMTSAIQRGTAVAVGDGGLKERRWWGS